ncbi:metallophosphoesterase [Fibrella sp. WM1]|uniref:metallophosphoesterase n=1 Tax=Fibrella musci TaxID=3242485 RepID=UPI003521A1BC
MSYTLRFVYFVALLFIVSSPGAAQTIVRGPYLQNVTPTSIVVRWRTDQPTDSRVRFGDNLARQAADGQQTTEHVVTLTGLQPATRYGYVVGTSAKDLLTPDASYFFITSPAPASVAPVRLWVLGDFGTGSERQKQATESFVEASKSRRPDLWVWLGDNAYSSGTDDEYQRYVFDYYPTYLRNLPAVATPGNHDYHDDNNDFNVPYYALTSHPQRGEAGGVPSGSPSYYSLDYGPVHLISLDSFGNEAGKHRIWDTTGTQIQWLKRDLAANKKPWTIIFFHHPPYTQGSRNADTEQDLILNRERLTPIFERYNVDLVLSGHSHVYERTYQIRGHRGLSTTFDKRTMTVDSSTGRYDGSANSCPILPAKGSVVYIVNGSGGANTGRAPNYPHKAMVYSYTDEGGSMLIDVAENRLDAQWIAPSGVKDRFTMVKNVNRRQTLSVEYADTLALTASWTGANVTGNGLPATYTWSNGQTGRTIRAVNQSGTFRVTDGRGCLADEYTVQVGARPRLSVSLTSTGAVCAGGSLAITTTFENTTKSAGQCELQLSDASGNFAASTVLGTFPLAKNQTVTLPTTLGAGSGYRLRLVSRGVPYADMVASAAFSVLKTATATVTGSASVLAGQPASVTLALTGSSPWRGSFSDGTTFSATASPTVVAFSAPRPGLTTLSSISNDCGSGTILNGNAVSVLLPTPTEPIIDNLVHVYPNPGNGDTWVEFLTDTPDPVQLRVLTLTGTEVSSQSIGNVTKNKRIFIHNDRSGPYFIQVIFNNQTKTYKIVR